MSSAAAHWSPAVTELVQLARKRWRDNCFVGTKKRFQGSRRADLSKCAIKQGPRAMHFGACLLALLWQISGVTGDFEFAKYGLRDS